MKRKNVFAKALLSSPFILLLTFHLSPIKAQVIPELIFKNPVLESGTDRQVGAKYRFANAAQDVDAIVEIRKKSSKDVVINNIDLTTFGWDKAFQPELGIPGSAPANQNWWVEFEMSFVKKGGNSKSKVQQFAVTALDVDGDNYSVQEYVQLQKPDSVSYSTISSLVNGVADAEVECGECEKISTLMVCSNCKGTGINSNKECGNCKGHGQLHTECGHAWDGKSNALIQGPVANFLNIDTLSTTVMSTSHYSNVDKFRFKIGARSGAKAGGAGMRLNSLWFKSFNLSTTATLPITLVSFDATLQNDRVMLKWMTADEINFSHFVVQRSTDGKEFVDRTLILNSTHRGIAYNFNETLEDHGSVYYRLKMVDQDGTFEYSKTKLITVSSSKLISTYPNPVINNLSISIPAHWQDRDVHYEIIDVEGKKVVGKKMSSASRIQNISLSDVAPGFYFIRLTHGAEHATKQIVKK